MLILIQLDGNQLFKSAGSCAGGSGMIRRPSQCSLIKSFEASLYFCGNLQGYFQVCLMKLYRNENKPASLLIVSCKWDEVGGRLCSLSG